MNLPIQRSIQSSLRSYLRLRMFSSNKIVQSDGNVLWAMPKKHKWRASRGLPLRRNEYGVMTDLPDWSYEDGTPGFLGTQQRARIQEMTDMAGKIKQYAKEMDMAITNSEMRRKRIVSHGDNNASNKRNAHGYDTITYQKPRGKSRKRYRHPTTAVDAAWR